MKKFEYKKTTARSLMKSGTDTVDIGILNRLGENGWELCTISNWDGKAAFFYFKREVQQDQNSSN